MTEFNNRGILFRNFRKQQPKHPDLTGEATIDGRKYRIAGWKKTGRRGEFHSLAFTPDTPRPDQGDASSPPEPAAAPVPSAGNDIPY